MMNETNVKKENRRALPKFLLVILAAALFGGAAGFFIAFSAGQGAADRVAAAFHSAIIFVTPWGVPASSLVLLGWAWRLYFQSKKICAAWDGEDETVVETAEEKLSWALLLGNIQLLLDFLFLSAAVHIVSLALPVAFLASTGVIVVLQQKIVDLTRQLNPEKQGSVYDLKFKKKWINSCDEAEQKQIGQAALKAYSAANTACPIIWCILLLLGFVFDIGLLPAVSVLAVWGVLSITYLLEAIRLGKPGKRGA